jgi:hypothetical protein
MSDRAANPARAVASGDGPSPATSERVSAPARELAQRLSLTDEVLLPWHPRSDRVELSIRDPATGACLLIEVAPGSAVDRTTAIPSTVLLSSRKDRASGPGPFAASGHVLSTQGAPHELRRCGRPQPIAS